MTAQQFLHHYFAALLTIYVVSFWLIVCALSSRFGGWYALARVFRTQFPFEGSKWRFQSGQMRGFINYGNCLTVGASREGVYLAVLPLLRFMHPPLLVPWSEIKVQRSKIWVFEYVRFIMGREAAVPLRIRGALAAKLRAAAGNSWPIEET